MLRCIREIIRVFCLRLFSSEAIVWRCSKEKDVLKNFAKFTGKHLRSSLFFRKVAAQSTPPENIKKHFFLFWVSIIEWPATLYMACRDTPVQMFSREYRKIFNDLHWENCVLSNSVEELTEIEAWLLLTFLLCLYNQLISAYLIVTYSRVEMSEKCNSSNRQKRMVNISARFTAKF